MALKKPQTTKKKSQGPIFLRAASSSPQGLWVSLAILDYFGQTGLGFSIAEKMKKQTNKKKHLLVMVTPESRGIGDLGACVMRLFWWLSCLLGNLLD